MSIGIDDGQFASYADELSRLDKTFAGDADLRDLWLNPASSPEARLAAVDQLTGPLALSPATANLLRLLVERRRVADLPLLAASYRELVDEKVGRVQAVATSARPLSEEQRAALVTALNARTGKQIILETKVDASLLGGVRAQVGSVVYDGSVKTQLEKLSETLHSGH
jgi:F-type H+-transporting ATPase subunit delta